MSASAIAENIFRRLADDGRPAETQRLVAVRGGAHTRWLLPAGEREIGTVLASWTPYRVWSQMAWSIVRAATGIGGTSALPGVAKLEVDGVSEAQWQSLGWRWNGTPIPVIYVGTPGPKRKAVMHLVERATSECRAAVKVPLTDEAKTAILHEAGVLQTLECERYPFAPRLLYVDASRGIATQTFVAGRPAARKLAPEYSARSGPSCARIKPLPSQPTPNDGHASTTPPGPSMSCTMTPSAGLLGAWRLHPLEHPPTARQRVRPAGLGERPAQRSATHRRLPLPPHAELPVRRKTATSCCQPQPRSADHGHH